MHRFSFLNKQPWRSLRTIMAPVIVIAATTILGFLFYIQGQNTAEHQLRERMLNAVSVAALLFDGEQVEAIRTTDDIDSPEYRIVVETLEQIRALSPNVRFMYIMRKTDNPMMLEFVADADGLSTPEELDYNHNGKVDSDEEPGLPGDEYPVDETPVLQGTAFNTPIVDPAITHDQWGTLISSYAPITDDQGKVVAVLGMDILADEFFQITRTTFSQFAVVLVALVGLFLAMYMVVIMRQKHVESLKVLDEERSAMVDLAMHQLGMPLATFRWWLEIMREDKTKSAGNEDALNQLQEGVHRMESIMQAIEKAANLQENMQNYTPSSAHVQDVIGVVLKESELQYKGRNQKITLNISPDTKPVCLEPKVLEGILIELLENASWYSPEKSEVIVSAHNLKKTVEITVEDKGYGISKEELPRIFLKFRRGPNASRYKQVGYGLGLFTVRSIVERAGGTVRIASTVNKGTAITFTLPTA